MYLGTLGTIPLNRLAQTGAEVYLREEAELTLGAGDIKLAPRLTIGFAGIPIQVAAETNLLRDDLNQIADADFKGAAEVDRLGTVVPLGGADDTLGGIAHEKEIHAWGSHRRRV